MSFPGKYPSRWDVLTRSEDKSIGCVFLTDAEAGLGVHVADPDNPGNPCRCLKLYGKIEGPAYLSILKKPVTAADRAAYHEQKQFKMADAAAMNQIFLEEKASRADQWPKRLEQALAVAQVRAAQNHGRAPWGCKWFDDWVQNVLEAHRLGQTLEVYYFEGEVGMGKIAWDDLAVANNWDGVGLGGSQKGEVAFLDKRCLPYEELDSSTVDLQIFEL